MEQPSQHPMVFSVKAFCLQEMIPDQTNDQLQLKVNKLSPGQDLTLLFKSTPGEQYLSVEDGNKAPLLHFPICDGLDCCQVGNQSCIVTFENLSIVLQFKAKTDMRTFQQLLSNSLDKELTGGRGGGGGGGSRGSCLSPETSPSKFHGVLSLQQSLLQDYHKTATYHRAVLLNETDFKDKVVLDVSSGSGMLSFFAVQAGAAKVFRVEPGPLAKYTQIMDFFVLDCVFVGSLYPGPRAQHSAELMACSDIWTIMHWGTGRGGDHTRLAVKLGVLVQSNGLSDKILVLNSEVDSVLRPEAVDVIVSEPMGHMLLSDRLVEKVLSAKKCLKPNGLMFPSWADLHVAPFSDEQLYFEHHARAAFWQQRNFYGVNLSSLHNSAVDEFFRQPIVDTFDVQVLVSRSVKHRIDFKETTPEDLRRLEIPFAFSLQQSGLVHGLAFWFDVAFQGSKATVWMSTAPTEPLTRWSQVRCLLQTPLFAKMGQTLSGAVLLIANDRQSYDVHITATVVQSGFTSGNVLDLKNPFYRMPSC